MTNSAIIIAPRGLCIEEAINVSTLTEGEECWISNGVRGFMFGRISPAT